MFRLQDRYYPADGVVAVVQINERDVEVRYASRSQGALLLTDTTVEKVTAAIDIAKSTTDSA